MPSQYKSDVPVHVALNHVRSVALIAIMFAGFYALTFAGALVYSATSAMWQHGPRLRGASGLVTMAVQSSVKMGESGHSLSFGERAEAVAVKAVEIFWFAAPYVTAAACLWILIGVLINMKMINGSMGLRPVDRHHDARFVKIVENLCRRNKLDIPRISVMEVPELNAFASGMSKSQYQVTATRGLLDRLTDAEVEAVVAHELAHIQHQDVRLMVIASVIGGVIPFALEAVWHAMFFNRAPLDGDDASETGVMGWVVMIFAFVLVLAVWLLSTLGQLALSRTREYLADAGGVGLTGNPDAMASALRKICGDSDLAQAPSSVMAMCIDNPRSGLMNLFSTHPDAEKRLEAIGRLPRQAPVVERRTPQMNAAPTAMRRASFGKR